MSQYRYSPLWHRISEELQESKSLAMAKEYLGKTVTVTMDRPLGSKHPKHGFVYEANYGFVQGTKAPDGEELDAYFLGIDEPVQSATGTCVAIAHRKNDDDDKLIVIKDGVSISKEDIVKAIKFQEGFFDSEIVGM